MRWGEKGKVHWNNALQYVMLLPWSTQSGFAVKRSLFLLLGLLIMAPRGPAVAQEEELRGLAYWNGIKADVVETGSGLKYKAQIIGKGKFPKSNSRVSVHYRGLLLNGVVFDTSFEKDEPVTLSLRSVIKGWQEGIPLMPIGSVFVFLIPPELAYGERGSDVIPPNATLIFEVELFGAK